MLSWGEEETLLAPTLHPTTTIMLLDLHCMSWLIRINTDFILITSSKSEGSSALLNGRPCPRLVRGVEHYFWALVKMEPRK